MSTNNLWCVTQQFWTIWLIWKKYTVIYFILGISKKILEKIGVDAFGITFSAYNLWTLTNYTGNDPEASTMDIYAAPLGTGYSEITNSSPYRSMTRGYDKSAQPRPINVSLAVNLKF